MGNEKSKSSEPSTYAPLLSLYTPILPKIENKSPLKSIKDHKDDKEDIKTGDDDKMENFTIQIKNAEVFLSAMSPNVSSYIFILDEWGFSTLFNRNTIHLLNVPVKHEWKRAFSLDSYNVADIHKKLSSSLFKVTPIDISIHVFNNVCQLLIKQTSITFGYSLTALKNFPAIYKKMKMNNKQPVDTHTQDYPAAIFDPKLFNDKSQFFYSCSDSREITIDSQHLIANPIWITIHLDQFTLQLFSKSKLMFNISISFQKYANDHDIMAKILDEFDSNLSVSFSIFENHLKITYKSKIPAMTDYSLYSFYPITSSIST